MKRDKLILSDSAHQSKCFCCLNYGHRIIQCPRLVAKFHKDIIIQRYQRDLENRQVQQPINVERKRQQERIQTFTHNQQIRQDLIRMRVAIRRIVESNKDINEIEKEKLDIHINERVMYLNEPQIILNESSFPQLDYNNESMLLYGEGQIDENIIKNQELSHSLCSIQANLGDDHAINTDRDQKDIDDIIQNYVGGANSPNNLIQYSEEVSQESNVNLIPISPPLFNPRQIKGQKAAEKILKMKQKISHSIVGESRNNRNNSDSPRKQIDNINNNNLNFEINNDNYKYESSVQQKRGRTPQYVQSNYKISTFKNLAINSSKDIFSPSQEYGHHNDIELQKSPFQNRDKREDVNTAILNFQRMMEQTNLMIGQLMGRKKAENQKKSNIYSNQLFSSQRMIESNGSYNQSINNKAVKISVPVTGVVENQNTETKQRELETQSLRSYQLYYKQGNFERLMETLKKINFSSIQKLQSNPNMFA